MTAVLGIICGYFYYLSLESPCNTEPYSDLGCINLEASVFGNDVSLNGIQAAHDDWGFTGDSIVISIRENLYDVFDLDLSGRHINHSSQIFDNPDHATNVATMVGGAGLSHPTGLGVAFDCDFTSTPNFGIPVMANSDNYFAETQATIQTHAYGTEVENFYGIGSASFDKSAINNRNLLHVVSAGNQGESESAAGPYQGLTGWANITGSFKMAKNILTVGACDRSGNVQPFSSKGPAFDGRVKPALVAFSPEGTSNAAARVAGAGAVIQEAIKSQTSTIPAQSLVKGILIAGAEDVETTGVDFKTGYGNLNLKRSLDIIKAGNYFMDNLVDGQLKTHAINIASKVHELRIVVSWTDALVTDFTKPSLVNDINAQLVKPNGAVIHPWVAPSDPSMLGSGAIRSIDSVNNTELITIRNIDPGSYQLKTTGRRISSSSQEIAIAYFIKEENQFDWRTPGTNQNYPFDGFSESCLSWESSYDSSATGKLEVMYNSNGKWELQGIDIPLTTKCHPWIAQMNAKYGQLKMTILGHEYLSPTFSLDQEIVLQKTLDCEDQIVLKWPNSDLAKQFKITQIVNFFPELVDLVRDSVYAVPRPLISSGLFQVTPIYPNNIQGLPSFAMDANDGDPLCYPRSFTAFEEDSNVSLSLDLGSYIGVEKVQLEKSLNGTWSILETFNTPNQDVLEFIDDEPIEGLNRYQARIQSIAGNEYISDVQEIFYLQNLPFLVFPNPTTPSTGINIFTKDFTGEKVLFSLYDPQGRHLFEQVILSDRDFVDLKDLSSGVYQYVLTSDQFTYSNFVLLHQN